MLVIERSKAPATPVILSHENPGFPHGRGRPYNTRMLVIISGASLSSGGLEVCVQRPQHHANASRIYRSSEQVKATLLNFGIAEKANFCPQLGNGERLKLTSVDVPHHDLVAEGGRLVVQIQSCHQLLRPEYAAVPNRLSFGVSAGQRTSKLPSCLRRSPVAESKIPSFSANSLPIADPRPLWIFGSIQLMITFLQCYKVYESSGRETDADCRDLLLQHKLPH